MSDKTAQFRRLLASGELEFLLEAHNGISAKIAEEAGFKGLWAGGLCMSAQYGVRDSNEAAASSSAKSTSSTRGAVPSFSHRADSVVASTTPQRRSTACRSR